MLVRVTRSDWTAVFTVDDNRMEEVIELANKHFGGGEETATTGVYEAVAREKSRLSKSAKGRNQGR